VCVVSLRAPLCFARAVWVQVAPLKTGGTPVGRIRIGPVCNEARIVGDADLGAVDAVGWALSEGRKQDFLAKTEHER